MTFVVLVTFAGCLAIETVRWKLRPVARRLRQIRAIDRSTRG